MSNQYGWSTDQILDLTYKEVNWRIEAINNRLNDTRTFNASIHGIELKGAKTNKKEYNLSKEDQDKSMDALTKSVNARKRNGNKRI